MADNKRSGLFGNDVFDGAASLAYYLTLALFPGFLAFFAILSLFSPEELVDLINSTMVKQIPADIQELLLGVLQDVWQKGGLSLFSVSFLVMLWIASSGVQAVMRQVNRAYGYTERRHFLQLRGLAILLLFSFGFLLLISMLFVSLSRLLMTWFIIYGDWVNLLLKALVFLTVEFFLLINFALVYYIAPSAPLKFRLFSRGAVLGSLLFIVLSLAFGYYINNLADYSKIYGSLAAIISLLFWLYCFGFLLILGAKLNRRQALTPPVSESLEP